MSTFNTAQWGGFGGNEAIQSVTGDQIIHDALRDLTVLRPGQTASDDVKTECLRQLNRLLDSWNTDRLMTPGVSRSEYALSAGVATYAFGRPMRIEGAAIVSSGGTQEIPIDLLSFDQYSRGLSGVYSDNAFPLATFYVQPTPISADTLVLYTWEPFPGFDDLETQYAFPPGYALAMEYCLAMQIAPRFSIPNFIKGNPLYDQISRTANETKARIKSLNAPMPVMQCDPALVGSWNFNIYTGR